MTGHVHLGWNVHEDGPTLKAHLIEAHGMAEAETTYWDVNVQAHVIAHSSATVALAILRKIARAGADDYANLEDGHLTLDLHAELDPEEAELLGGLLENARDERDADYQARQDALDAERGTRVRPGIPRPVTTHGD